MGWNDVGAGVCCRICSWREDNAGVRVIQGRENRLGEGLACLRSLIILYRKDAKLLRSLGLAKSHGFQPQADGWSIEKRHGQWENGGKWLRKKVFVGGGWEGFTCRGETRFVYGVKQPCLVTTSNMYL